MTDLHDGVGCNGHLVLWFHYSYYVVNLCVYGDVVGSQLAAIELLSSSQCKRVQNTAAETVTPKGNVIQKLYSDYSGTIYVVSQALL